MSRPTGGPPHVAVVSQNLDLASDLRPRREAEALAAAGYAVTLVGGTDDPTRVRALVAPAVDLALFPMPTPAGGTAGQLVELGTAFVRLLRTLRRLARERRIDVLHAANPPDDLWLFVPILRLLQGSAPALVFDQHDVVPELLAAKVGTGPALLPLRAVIAALERASFRLASLVVFPNASYRTRAERRGLLRVVSAVVPNGWSLPAVEPDPELRGDADAVLAYVGSIGEQDDVVHLVDAVARLREPARMRVIVAGDGPALRDAQSAASRLGVAGSFEWLGWVTDRKRIGAAVATADVCVAPEQDSDFNRVSTLVKLIEYMSAGAAIAAHRLPSSLAICGDAAVEFAEDMTADGLAVAVQRLLDDEELAAMRRDAARARFETELRWESVGAERLCDAYRTTFPLPASEVDATLRGRLTSVVAGA